MHRLALAVAIATATALAAPALADAGSTTYRLDYTGGGFGGVGPLPYLYGSGHAQGSDVGAVALATPRSARKVTVAVADRTGRPVLAEVESQVGGQPAQPLGEVCGAARTFRLPRPGATLHVYLLSGQCGTQASVPTTGTVALTLLRR